MHWTAKSQTVVLSTETRTCRMHIAPHSPQDATHKSSPSEPNNDIMPPSLSLSRIAQNDEVPTAAIEPAPPSLLPLSPSAPHGLSPRIPLAAPGGTACHQPAPRVSRLGYFERDYDGGNVRKCDKFQSRHF